MKKYVILFFITIAVIITMKVGVSYLNNSIVDVDIIDVATSTVENTVLCSGIVEYSNSQNVISNCPALINDIYVKEGEQVKKGDSLVNLTNVKIDKNSAPNIDPSDINSVGGLNNIENIQEVYNNFLLESQSKNNNYTKFGDPYNLKAPISGLAVSVNIKKNDIINGNSSIITIADTNKMQVKLSVNESKISDIKLGQRAIITGVGFKGLEYSGKVTKISNEAEKIVGPSGKETVVNVIVELDSANKDIKPGYTAKCKIITSKSDNVLLTPYESVKSDNSGQEYLYKYVNGKAIKTFVETGNEYQNGYEIISGITLGDRVIQKTDKLYNNCRVNIDKNNY